MAKLDLIGTGEACDILGVHQATLLRWLDAGKIRHAGKLPPKNGAYLWHRGDVERLAAERAEETA